MEKATGKMADTIVIKTGQLDLLQRVLSDTIKYVKKPERVFKNIGIYQQSSVERRYMKSGPGYGGGEWHTILASSMAQRYYSNKRKVPKWLLKTLRKDTIPASMSSTDKAKMKTRSEGATEIPIAKAQPLRTTRAAHSSYRVTDTGVEIYSMGLNDVWHQPTSLTGVGSGKNLDRAAFYLDDKDDVEITGLISRFVETAFDEAIKSLASKGGSI